MSFGFRQGPLSLLVGALSLLQGALPLSFALSFSFFSGACELSLLNVGKRVRLNFMNYLDYTD